MRFEFHQFDENSDPIACTVEDFKSDSSARSRAGTLAKQNGGPVDLARVGESEWADRYITTASPSPHHTAGYRCERLDG